MGNVRLELGDSLDVLKTLDSNSVDAVVSDPPYGLEFMGKSWDTFKTGRGAKYKSGGVMQEDVSIPGTGFTKLPSYTNRPAKRCAICGKQAWSGSPCVCENPEWEMDNSVLHSFQEFNRQWAKECLRVLKPGGYLLAFGGTRMVHRLTAGIEDAGQLVPRGGVEVRPIAQIKEANRMDRKRLFWLQRRCPVLALILWLVAAATAVAAAAESPTPRVSHCCCCCGLDVP